MDLGPASTTCVWMLMALVADQLLPAAFRRTGNDDLASLRTLFQRKALIARHARLYETLLAS